MQLRPRCLCLWFIMWEIYTRISAAAVYILDFNSALFHSHSLIYSCWVCVCADLWIHIHLIFVMLLCWCLWNECNINYINQECINNNIEWEIMEGKHFASCFCTLACMFYYNYLLFWIYNEILSSAFIHSYLLISTVRFFAKVMKTFFASLRSHAWNYKLPCRKKEKLFESRRCISQKERGKLLGGTNKKNFFRIRKTNMKLNTLLKKNFRHKKTKILLCWEYKRQRSMMKKMQMLVLEKKHLCRCFNCAIA